MLALSEWYGPYRDNIYLTPSKALQGPIKEILSFVRQCISYTDIDHDYRSGSQ